MSAVKVEYDEIEEINEKEKDEFLARLISLVQQNKILYEKSHKYYYNRRKKETVWNDIAAQTNKTSTECKAKWTALREKFVRELKKKQKPIESSVDGEYVEWELFSEMLFLKDVTTPRPRPRVKSSDMVQTILKYPSTPPPLDEDPFLFIEDSSAPTQIKKRPFDEECSTPPPLKKRSFDELCEQFGNIICKLEERIDSGPQRNDDSDADELFIRTVVSMIQDLPSSAKDEIKSDIFSKILEVKKKFREVC